MSVDSLSQRNDPGSDSGAVLLGKLSGVLRVFTFITYSADIRRLVLKLGITTQAFNAALTCSMRSWPQNISSPTKKVGAPNTPRSTAFIVTALSWSLVA